MTLTCNLGYKFLAKNTSLSTVSGLREALWHETMFPLALKTLSDGELVAGTHSYFLANLANLGKFASWMLHHLSGFVSLSAFADYK